jgi:glycosyltransferase involved in cell wall biosynthesis
LARGTRKVESVSVTYTRCVGPRRFFFSPETAAKIAELAPKHDLVHVHGMWGFGTIAAGIACGLLRVPYLLSPRGMLDPWALAQSTYRKQVFLALAGGRILGGAARIHYTMEGERQVVPPRFRGLPSVVVSNPVEIARFSEVPLETPDTGRIELLMLGRIHQKKGFDLALPALKRVIEQGVPARLTLAGPDEGGYRAEVARIATELGVSEHITFLGLVSPENLAQLFASSHMLLMPSYQENFGRSAAEAMAAGRPVVVSERVDIWPNVQRAEAGLVVPLNADALANAVMRLASSVAMRVRMGTNGRRFAEHQYAPTGVAERMLEVYRDVVTEQRFPDRRRPSEPWPDLDEQAAGRGGRNGLSGPGDAS